MIEICLDMSFSKEDILKKLQEKLNNPCSRRGSILRCMGKGRCNCTLKMKNAESMINQWKQRFGKINKTKRYISTTATPHPPGQFYLHRRWLFLKSALRRFFRGV